MNNIPSSSEPQFSWANPFASLYSLVKAPLDQVYQLFTGSAKNVAINSSSPLAKLTDEVFLKVLELTIDPNRFFAKDRKDIFATCRGARALLPKYLLRHEQTVSEIVNKADLWAIPKTLCFDVKNVFANITFLNLHRMGARYIITQCPKLKQLCVDARDIRDYIEAATSCPQLQSLTFSTVTESDVTIYEKGLARLGSLSHLTSLVFSHRIQIRDHKHLGLLPQLEELQIGGDFLQHAAIPQFNNVRKLTLTHGVLQDEDFATLKRRPKLESLIIGANFRGLGTFLGTAVAYQNSLQDLEFSRANNLNDAALVHLGKFENLGSFTLCQNDHVTGSGIASLQACKNLTSLELQKCSAVTTLEGIAHLSRLHELTLYDMPALCDNAFECLNSLAQLTILRLSGIGITEPQMQAISKIKSLEYLEISDWQGANVNVLKLLVALPNLGSIYVTCNFAISDLISVLQTYPALVHLRIDGTLNEEERREIRTKLPNLQKLETSPRNNNV